MYSVITYINVVIAILCDMSLSNLMPLLPPPVPNALISETDVNVKENSFVFKVNEPSLHNQKAESDEPALHNQKTESDAAKSVVNVRKNRFALKGKPSMQRAIKETYSTRESTTIVNGVKIWKPNVQRNKERKIWNKNYDNSTSVRLNYNDVKHEQPLTSDKTKKSVQDELPESVPGSESDDAVSDIDLLQALLKIMPKRNRKNAIKKIVNSFFFTSPSNNTNLNTDISSTTVTPTTAKTTEPLNNVDQNLDSSNVHKNIDVRMKKKNRRDKYIEEVNVTDNPHVPTEVTEHNPPLMKEESSEYQHTNNLNTKGRRQFRRRNKNFNGKNMRFKSSGSNRAKQERENEKSKFGFTGKFERMYRRLFGKRHVNAATTTTSTTTTLPPDYMYYDYNEVTNLPIDYDQVNSEDPHHGHENRERYRDLAKSKYNWNRQSSKESFNQYQDVEKIDIPTENDKRYNKRPGWNIPPKNNHRKIHISSTNEVLRHWKKKSYDERLESKGIQHGNYVPYDFEVAQMREMSKTPNKDIFSVQSAEYIISEPSIQRIPQTKIDQNIVLPSQYDFEAKSHTLHEQNKFRGPNHFELKNKSHSDDVKPSVRVDPTFLLTKMVQEAVHKALANLHLVGQSNANAVSKPQVTDDSESHPDIKKATLGLRKSVDIDKKSTLPMINNISPRNNANNDKLQWLEPVSVAKPDEKSNTSREVTNAETMKSSQYLKNSPFEYPNNVQTTPKSPLPSWMTRKTFTRRTLDEKRRKIQRKSQNSQQKPPVVLNKMNTNKRSIYYTWKNGRLVLVKTVKAPRYSGQTKKNKSKESKNISAQKGATTLSPNVDSPYFDYALPATDPPVW